MNTARLRSLVLYVILGGFLAGLIFFIGCYFVQGGTWAMRPANQHLQGSSQLSNAGTITDRNHRQLGRVSADMQVYDAKGTRIGYITVDGAVHDGESRTLGHIDRKTGKVTDASYKIIGYGEDLNIVWIACYFFFGFFS